MLSGSVKTEGTKVMQEDRTAAETGAEECTSYSAVSIIVVGVHEYENFAPTLHVYLKEKRDFVKRRRKTFRACEENPVGGAPLQITMRRWRGARRC